MAREPQRRRKETPVWSANPSICSHPEVLDPVFPQLVFKAGQAKYEWLGEVNVFDKSAQILFQVNIHLHLIVVKDLFEIFDICWVFSSFVFCKLVERQT